MKTFNALLKRNIKMFFNDKAMFFTSLITPVILLVLYATFLGNVYRDSFLSSLPKGFSLDGKIIDGFVGGQLVSSLLAVCCVTVSFCSNMLMVQDKVSRARTDFEITPVKKSVLSLSYFTATFISTLIISIAASAVCLLYLLKCGWYLSLSDIQCYFASSGNIRHVAFKKPRARRRFKRNESFGRARRDAFRDTRFCRLQPVFL